MKDFLKVLKRYLPPYKKDLLLNFLFNVLGAFFAVFSVVMMIPILEIILMQDNTVYELEPMSMSMDVLKNNLYYYITELKTEHGPGLALLFVGTFIIAGTFLKVLFTYLASYTSTGIRNGVVKDIRRQIYNKIIVLPLGFFSNERKGDFIARSTGDVQEVENSVMSSLDMFLTNPVLIIVFLATMLVMSYQLTLFVFVLLPIAGGIIGRVGKSLKKTSTEGQTKMGQILGVIEETLTGLRIIKAFNAEKRMGKRFEGEIEEFRRIQNRLMRRRDMAHPLSELLGTIVIVIVVWFGGTLILNESSGLSPATFLAYLGIFYQIIAPAKAFSRATYDIQKGMAAMDRIDRILFADISIEEKPNAKTVSEFKSEIEYRSVGFSYNGSKKVLENVSIKIPKGKTIALVGQSGGGKTTFIDLLPRFYDVDAGGIFIDGTDIRDLKLHDLRELMGNVNQEAILFNDTF